MFFLIEFDNIDSKETQQLLFDLSGYPNGTILSSSSRIKVTNLPKHKWVVWIDISKKSKSEYIQECEHFLRIKNVKSFIELPHINREPGDSGWLWEDDYINNLFAELC